MTPEEFLSLLETYLPGLHADIQTLMDQASHMSADDFVRWAQQAYPDVVTPHVAVAAELAAHWYEESGNDAAYQAITAPMPDIAQLAANLRWSLSTDNPRVNLLGSAERVFYNGARQTIVDNSNDEPGATWARHAEPGACAFCKMLATRDDVYTSKEAAESVVGRGRIKTGFRSDGSIIATTVRTGQTRGTRELGEEYHDHCKCIAVMVRPGQEYKTPEYAQGWNDQYEKAVAQAGRRSDVKDIIKAWRELDAADN